jgi:hypothetical protein
MGQSGTGTSFCPSTSAFPLSVSTHQFSTLIHQNTTQKDERDDWEPSVKI